jgi:hypothetical protein
LEYIFEFLVRENTFLTVSNYSFHFLFFDNIQYFSERCVVIRASGNPLTRELWKQLISSDDVCYNQPGKHKLVSIDSCEVYAGNMAAVTTFTMDVYFTYKGTQNEDRAKISLAWANEGGIWKIMLFHRATGREIPQED